ncbi:MAG: GTPase Era [Bacteroidetes bacterium]|nr:GTPase Era [Bacteroidota bacterium]
MHKSGFVNIIGKPNVGKSTLMNAFLGEKLSIVTHKAQTTRHRIRGILNGEDYQIVYSDTPGIVNPHYKLHEAMMNFVSEALEDADMILFLTEIKDKNPIDEKTLSKLKKLECPILVLINKIDLGEQNLLEKKVEEWKEILPNAEVIPVSALEKFNTDYILKRIISLLPESPPYFPQDELSDKSQRFFISEIIREKIFLLFHEEIPYSTEVVVEEFKEAENIIRIRAIIYVMREGQKAILIGKQGSALKKLGTKAREEIELFLDKKVFLETIVKVEKDWREKENKLKKFGYLE